LFLIFFLVFREASDFDGFFFAMAALS